MKDKKGRIVLSAKRQGKRGYLRIFASYYRPHWKLFALDMVCALFICIVDLAFPYFSRLAMKELLPQKLFVTFFTVMAVLAAAYIAGVDRVFAVGGVQAVAALAYGAGFIPRVDKIVGPGNAYVAAAKRLVYGSVDIDMVAGPSEVLVLADGSADPRYVAADLLGQAEHDRLASAILVTTSARLAEETAYELERQSVRLERRGIVVDSVTNYGAAIVCGTMEEAAAIANDVAPEHLEIMTENPRGVLPMIRNAGAVFLGAYTPEPLGDYLAGPSHVLPTSGSARFFSPIGVDSFIKRMSVIEYSKTALSEDADDITTVAYAEKLTAHAHAVEVRA